MKQKYTILRTLQKKVHFFIMERQTKRITETLNDRIKVVREYLKFTQQQMSKELGVSKSYYSDIENGRRSVSKKTIEKLHNALNVSIEFMYSGNGAIILGNDNNKELPNAPQSVPFNVPENVHLLNNHSSTAVDNILSNSIQILSFYCDYLIQVLYNSKLHQEDITALKQYSNKLNQYVDEIREKLRVNYSYDNDLDINEKINLINQLNLKIIDAMDLVREIFRRVRSIQFMNE